MFISADRPRAFWQRPVNDNSQRYFDNDNIVMTAVTIYLIIARTANRIQTKFEYRLGQLNYI